MRASIIAALISVAAVSTAFGRDGAATPSGGLVTLLIGFPPGQGNDVETGSDPSAVASQRLTADPTYEEAGRLYSSFLGRFLPGQPAIATKLAPGAASLVLARQMATTGPRDGSTLALLGPAAVLEPLIEPANASWSRDDFNWIGALQRDDDVCFARADAPVGDIDGLRRHELFVAAMSPGSRSFLYPRALNALAETRFHIISGYASGFEAARALETGETQAWCGWSIAALRNRHPELLREGKVKLLVQFTLSPDTAINGIPRADDLLANDDSRAAMRAIESQTRFGAYALAAPPGATPAKVAELRDGFAAMTRDPEFLSQAAARGFDIDPVPGEELQALALSLRETSPAARDLLRGVLRAR